MRFAIAYHYVGTPYFHAACLTLASAAAAQAAVAVWAGESRSCTVLRGIAIWLAVMALWARLRRTSRCLVFALSSPFTAALVAWQRAKRARAMARSGVEAGPDQPPRFRFEHAGSVAGDGAGGDGPGGRLWELTRHGWPASVTNYLLDVAAITAMTLAAVACVRSGKRWRSAAMLLFTLAAVSLAVCTLRKSSDEYGVWNLLNVSFIPRSVQTPAGVVPSTFWHDFGNRRVRARCIRRDCRGIPDYRQCWLNRRDRGTAGRRFRQRILAVLLAGDLLALALVYWQMLWIAPLTPPFSEGPTNYGRLLEIAGRVNSSSGSAAAGKERDMLLDEVIFLVQPANHVPPVAMADMNPPSAELYMKESRALRDLARSMTGEASAAFSQGDEDRALTLRLATIRLGLMLKRGCTEPVCLVGRALQGAVLNPLVEGRGRLLSDQARRTIAALARVLAEQEDLKTIIRRDEAVSERAYGWGCRFTRALDRCGVPNDIYPVFAASVRRSDNVMVMLQTDLAIRLYRRDYGGWPERLDDLVPEYLPSLPRETPSQRPFCYRVSGDDFVLYSVGQDGIDNGGQFTNLGTYYKGADRGDHTYFGAGYDFDLDTLMRP